MLQLRSKRPRTRSLIASFILIGLTLSLTFPALSQGQLFQESLRSYIQQPTTKLENIDTGTVYFDGRPLFVLTAGRIKDKKTPVSPVQERIKTVRNQIKAIAQKQIAPKTLSLTYDIISPENTKSQPPEPKEQLGIIKVNGQYLLTITDADAGIYSKNIESHTIALTEIIQSALTQYYEERQTPYLQRYGLLSIGIIIAASISTILVRSLKHQIQRRRTQAIERQNALKPEDLLEDVPEIDREHVLKMAHAQKEFQNRIEQIRFRYDMGAAGLQLILIALWVGCSLLILSFFPQTRWLQSLLFTDILRRFSLITLCIFGTYLLIRFSFLSTNYGFSLLRRGKLISNHHSVRSLLRLQTLSGYMKSVCVFIFTLGGLLSVLSILGLNLAPLLAGAGILGLAISFGAQNLIKDVINGLFVIWEDQFGVGDVITINAVTGSVETMNLRITQLRSQDGDLITIPNGRIEMVKNHSNQWSRVNLGIEVAYDTDLDQGMDVIRKTASMMTWDPQWRDYILEDPQVLGVDDFGANGITIRLWIKTVPLKQWEVSREFRRRLKLALDQAGISIPFPQRSIWFENKSEEIKNDS